MEPPPTPQNIEFWKKWALDGYIKGDNSLEEFEQAYDDAIHGRCVSFDGKPLVRKSQDG